MADPAINTAKIDSYVFLCGQEASIFKERMAGRDTRNAVRARIRGLQGELDGLQTELSGLHIEGKANNVDLSNIKKQKARVWAEFTTDEACEYGRRDEHRKRGRMT